MPPKKKDAKGGKKGGKDAGREEGGPLTPEQLLSLSNANVTSLKLQLADRSLESTRVVSEKKNLNAKIDDMHRELEEEQRATLELTKDMTRQYKGMQDELLGRITDLEKTAQDLRDQLDKSQQKADALLSEKDAIISQKNKEIETLKSQMEDMAQEFGEMLKETLEKMRERIEVNNSDGLDHADLPIQKRMDEVNLNHGVAGGL